jgi:lipopolysaccharide transport system permease protein
MARLPSNGIPYPLFSFVGLMMWQFFAKGLNEASLSLVANQSLLTKVYFPRLLLPLASVTTPLVDWCVSCGLLLGFLWAFDAPLLPSILYLPLWLGLAYICCFTGGVWLAALNAIYRDVAYVVPFGIQLAMFACPIIYPSSLVPEKWQWLYNLNPLASVIEGARASVLGTPLPSIANIFTGTLAAILLAWAGLIYFRRSERTLADKI